MQSRITAHLLCGSLVLLWAAPLRAQRPPGPSGGSADILSPKLCFSLQIPGNWVPAELPGMYVSPDGKAFVGVMAFDAKELKGDKGETLIEKEAGFLVRIHEKEFHQKLTGVKLAPFSSPTQGTWKWSASPARVKNREVPVWPRYLVDRSPEGIIVVEISGIPNDDALAGNIFAGMKLSDDRPCEIPRSAMDLIKGALDHPGGPNAAGPTATDLQVPARLFKNPALPWSIQIPGNWQMNAVDPRRVFIKLAGFGDVTSCEIMSVPVQLETLDEFADFWLRQTAEFAASQGARMRRTDRQRITLPGGVEAIDVRSEISGGGRSRTVLALVNGAGYVLDCATSEKRWESIAPVFAKISGSFTIEKKE